MFRLLKRLALAILVPAVLLAVAELVLWLMGYGFPKRFLVEQRIQERVVLTDNQFFGYRFFPPRMARTATPVVALADKPADVIRICVLGESAAMGDPVPAFGFARQLQFLLSQRMPAKKFEVHNLAMTAVNSHVIREIARDLKKIQPDAVVLLIGNNEVIGPYGPGSIFGFFSRFPGAARMQVLFSRTRVQQGLRDLISRYAGRWVNRAPWQGMAMLMDRPVAAMDEGLVSAYKDFEINLRDIVARSLKAPAAVLLCTVPVNLRDCPPFGPQADAALTVDGRAKRDDFIKAAITAEQTNDFKAALENYQFAVQIDAHAADMKFLAARCADRLGDTNEAQRLYAEARDGDALRFRADQVINAIIRERLPKKYPEVALVDAEAHFQSLATNGTPGFDLFLDHVHPNFHGHYELATLLVAHLEKLPLLQGVAPAAMPTEAECAAAMLYNEWGQLEVLRAMRERREQLPFNRQVNNPAALGALHAEIARLEEAVAAAGFDKLNAEYDRAIQAAPGDWTRLLQAAGLALDMNRYEQALARAQPALQQLPYRYDVREWVALALGYSGKAAEGVQTITGQGPNGYFDIEGCLNVGRDLKLHNHPAEAVVFLERAYQGDPASAEIAIELANTYYRLERMDEAEKTLQAALKLYPGHVFLCEEMALLLSMKQRWEEADAYFMKAAWAATNRPDWQLKYALSLSLRGKPKEAEEQVRAYLQAVPDDPAALRQLERLQKEPENKPAP